MNVAVYVIDPLFGAGSGRRGDYIESLDQI